jgi:Tfp pilus assembly protein PilF
MAVFGSRKPSRITLADRAIAAGQWHEAAALYAEALAQNPRNPPIWVQLGHAMKETGRLVDAEVAYSRALSLEPNSADTHTQLGHVLKLQGKHGRAEAAYLRAFALERGIGGAAGELRSLGWTEDDVAELCGYRGQAAEGGSEPPIRRGQGGGRAEI